MSHATSLYFSPTVLPEILLAVVMPPQVVKMNASMQKQTQEAKEQLFQLLNMYRADLEYIKRKLDEIATRLEL